MLNQPSDGRKYLGFAEEELQYAKTESQGRPGIWVRYARSGSKNIEVESIPVLRDMIVHLNREADGLRSLEKDGTIPFNELDFYIKPIEGRIRLIEKMIDQRNAQAAIDVIGNIINPY
jgi:hypothetical protein